MRCPYCDFQGPWRKLQAHLAESHADQVELRVDEAGGRMVYRTTCPRCGLSYEHPVKPRAAPSFLQEYQREIRLVAFDVLIAHLAAEHQEIDEEAAGGGNP